MKTVEQKIRAANHHRKAWGKAIIRAAERGEFTEEEKVAADDWDKCACGKLSPKLPRYPQDYSEESQPFVFLAGGPKDKILFRWGMAFVGAVKHNKFDRAADLFIKINNRAAKLLAGA